MDSRITNEEKIAVVKSQISELTEKTHKFIRRLFDPKKPVIGPGIDPGTYENLVFDAQIQEEFTLHNVDIEDIITMENPPEIMFGKALITLLLNSNLTNILMKKLAHFVVNHDLILLYPQALLDQIYHFYSQDIPKPQSLFLRTPERIDNYDQWKELFNFLDKKEKFLIISAAKTPGFYNYLESGMNEKLFDKSLIKSVTLLIKDKKFLEKWIALLIKSCELTPPFNENSEYMNYYKNSFSEQKPEFVAEMLEHVKSKYKNQTGEYLTDINNFILKDADVMRHIKKMGLASPCATLLNHKLINYYNLALEKDLWYLSAEYYIQYRNATHIARLRIAQHMKSTIKSKELSETLTWISIAYSNITSRDDAWLLNENINEIVNLILTVMKHSSVQAEHLQSAFHIFKEMIAKKDLSFDKAKKDITLLIKLLQQKTPILLTEKGAALHKEFLQTISEIDKKQQDQNFKVRSRFFKPKNINSENIISEPTKEQLDNNKSHFNPCNLNFIDQ